MAAQIVNRDRLDAFTPEEGHGSELVALPQRGTVVERLRVYAGGYPVRVEEALTETFPAIAHVVGEAAFANLARRYVEARSLHSYNLNDAGADLPRFLRTDALTGRLQFLPDLGRLEWQVACAFHARDQVTFDPTAVVNWSMDDWQGARLRFQPWVALVTSEWPIREIWESREMPIEEIDIDLDHRPDRVLVRRSGYSVLCESVDDAEAELLGALVEGQTLGSAIATLTARGGDPASVSAWFTRWMALRLIEDCFIPGQDTGR